MASAIIEMEKFKDLLKKKNRLAVFVDGPNVLRRDVNLSLREIKENLKIAGLIKICRVYLNQNAPSKLVEAAINEGYEVVTTPSDVDVCMAVDATSAIYNPAINVIALVTRDTDFHFVLKKAKEMGKATIVVGAKENFSSALRNTADEAILLEGMKESEESNKERKKDEKEKKAGESKSKEGIMDKIRKGLARRKSGKPKETGNKEQNAEGGKTTSKTV
ncbi:MAG: hypothetical protein BWK75_03220 [Candidatus Altiarchaeales archaeon A3]|nr:MAG: hypothetical protein BWK75_03220 [Candidatus Altiarchaeales archaeon A3]